MTVLQHDLFVSACDAEALAAMLAGHRRAHRFEADASDALADLLMDARFVPPGELPLDRVAMGSIVTYAEEPSCARRTVTLALPGDAEPGKARISVLSPVGLALLGRRRGARVPVAAPNGRDMHIRILEITEAQ